MDPITAFAAIMKISLIGGAIGAGTAVVITALSVAGAPAPDMDAESPISTTSSELLAPPPIIVSPYVSAKIGANFAQPDDDRVDMFAPEPTGRNLSFALGLAVRTKPGNFRAEFEFSQNNLKGHEYDDFWPEETSLDMRVQTYMANFYVDCLEQYWIHPYFGLGAGGAYSDVKYSHSGGISHSPFEKDAWTSWDFAFGAYAGIGFKVVYGISADLGLRIVGAGNTAIMGAQAGLRYTF